MRLLELGSFSHCALDVLFPDLLRQRMGEADIATAQVGLEREPECLCQGISRSEQLRRSTWPLIELGGFGQSDQADNDRLSISKLRLRQERLTEEGDRFVPTRRLQECEAEPAS